MNQETLSLTKALSEFYYFYKYQYERVVKPRLIRYEALTAEERQLVPWYEAHTTNIQQCVSSNARFLQTVAVTIGYNWGFGTDPNNWETPTDHGFDRVRSLLLQSMREWSVDGQKERDSSFNKIISDLNQKFPIPQNRPDIKVLVPGCGLGRSIYDLNCEGYDVEGNEFGYHVMIMNQFFLNFCHETYEIYPFLHKLSNVACRDDQIRPVTVPDNLNHRTNVLANSDVNIKDLTTVGGSFIDVYGPPDLEVGDFYSAENHETRLANQKVDVVVTCFFLDTSPNIIEYLKTIKYILKSEGIWINFGPLQWHFEDDYSVMLKRVGDKEVQTMYKGLEMSRGDLVELVERFFTVLYRETVSGVYATDERSLSRNVYDCEYWLARVRSTSTTY